MSSTVTILLVVAVAFPLLVYVMQDSLLFHPQPLSEAQRISIRHRFPAVEEIVLQEKSVEFVKKGAEIYQKS